LRQTAADFVNQRLCVTIASPSFRDVDPTNPHTANAPLGNVQIHPDDLAGCHKFFAVSSTHFEAKAVEMCEPYKPPPAFGTRTVGDDQFEITAMPQEPGASQGRGFG
jgi:hypothetical protein